MGDMYGLRSAVVHGNAYESIVANMVPQSADALQEILLWYLDHIEEFKTKDEARKSLDVAIVDGGSTWAHTVKSDSNHA